MMTDPIADMLARLRNAQMASKSTVIVPASKVKGAILNVLKEEGYITDFANDQDSKHPAFVVTLKYSSGRPVISEISRISKPGLRVYKKAVEVPSVRDGLGISIVSTSQGVMTDAQAREKKLGGEVLCQVF